MSETPLNVLTFVPGTMCDERVWHPVWDALRPDFQINYLPMETARSRQDIQTLFDAAFEQSCAMDPATGKLHLVAFSMGGYFAFDYAVRHPERVASLVTICAAPMALSERERKQRKFTIEYLETHDYSGPSPGRLNQMLHKQHHGDSPIKKIMLDMDASLGVETLLTQMRETTDREDLTPRLSTLRCPCLIVVGDSDPIVSIAQGDAIAKALPHGELKVAANAGHMVPLEVSSWLASELKAFHEIKISEHAHHLP